MNGLVLENKTKSEMNPKNTTLNGHERKRMQQKLFGSSELKRSTIAT